MDKICALGASALTLLVATGPVSAQSTGQPQPAASRCEGTAAPGSTAPTPSDPFPLLAAGWGPEAGQGRMVCRWAEDWTGLRAAGNAPALKAVPLGGGASLTLSAEARVRYDAYVNGQLTNGNDDEQGLFRGVLGADLRINPHLRTYAEIATGQLKDRRSTATANFQNEASLQQAFVEVRGDLGSTLVGALMGRQEFTDGPRQLLSLSDGPNLHRTWNGARVFIHDSTWRLGAFDLRGTRLKSGSFDEEVNHGERFQGVNASLNLTPGGGPNTYLDPFWFHTENPGYRSGGHAGLDDRDTFGLRLWGRTGTFKFDWTLAHQSGRYLGREIEAWGLFAVQSLALSSQGWKPTLTAHLDLATGGGAYGPGKLKAFNPLYGSSSYLGEGQFLSLSNLVLVAPGVSVSPTSATTLSLEYGFARRLDERDAVYAGGMKAYAGTPTVAGREIGGLFRLMGSWAASSHLTLFVDYEHLVAGQVLQRVHRPSGTYGYVGATFRY